MPPSGKHESHYPDGARDELFELVFSFLVSEFLGFWVQEPVVILIEGLHVDVRDLAQHCSQLCIAWPLAGGEKKQKKSFSGKVHQGAVCRI